MDRIERVARAISRAMAGDDDEWEFMRGEAEAAIEAADGVMPSGKKMGRPRKAPGLSKRRNMTFRATDDMLDRLHAYAGDRRSSASEAVEHIINQHFSQNDLMRVARETIRQEMRAEFEARREEQLHTALFPSERGNVIPGAVDVLMTEDGPVELRGPEWEAARARAFPLLSEQEAAAQQFVERAKHKQ